MSMRSGSLDTAYREYRGLLFAAVGKMARQGFVVPPADAADLVHDFFLDAWTGVESRYQPERASMSTYVYASFVRFARPRIVRLQRLQGALLGPEDLVQLADRGVTVWSANELDPNDLSRVRQAVAVLPMELQEPLKRWLADDASSERKVALELGLSRYELRQKLVDALGQVSLAMGELRVVKTADLAVAKFVWHDRLTLEEAAGQLGMSVQQVRNASVRNQQVVRHSLASVRRGRDARQDKSQAPITRRSAQVAVQSNVQTLEGPEGGQSREGSMTTSSEEPSELVALVERVAARPNDAEVLTAVRRRAAELLQYFERSDAPSPQGWESLPAEWAAQIYGALAEGLGGSEVHEQAERAESEAYADDMAQVGRVFSEVLVPALPESAGVQQLVQGLRRLELTVDLAMQRQLQSRAEVVNGGGDAERLATFGVTPLHLVRAADAVGLVLKRAIQAGYFGRGEGLLARRDATGTREVRGVSSGNVLTKDQLASQISTVADVPPAVSGVLLDWLVGAAPSVTALFVSFTASFDGQNVLLLADTGDAANGELWTRWSPRQPERGSWSGGGRASRASLRLGGYSGTSIS